jgi:hypothetical protein
MKIALNGLNYMCVEHTTTAHHVRHLLKHALDRVPVASRVREPVSPQNEDMHEVETYLRTKSGRQSE